MKMVSNFWERVKIVNEERYLMGLGILMFISLINLIFILPIWHAVVVGLLYLQILDFISSKDLYDAVIDIQKQIQGGKQDER